ncbi:MAG: hypothetical protein LBB58_05035 [Cellulomonadaceae bacterium]|nr:hypothetical protein [Cellulomonadaceae bacterium]
MPKVLRGLGFKLVGLAAAFAVGGMFLGHTLASWVDQVSGNDIVVGSGHLDLVPIDFRSPDLDPTADGRAAWIWISICDSNADAYHSVPCVTTEGLETNDIYHQASIADDDLPHVFLEVSDALLGVSFWQAQIKGQNIAARLDIQDFVDDSFNASGTLGEVYAARGAAIVPFSPTFGTDMAEALDNAQDSLLLTEANDGDIFVVVIGYRGVGIQLVDTTDVAVTPYAWGHVQDCATNGWFPTNPACNYGIASINNDNNSFEDKTFILEDLTPRLSQVRDAAVVIP